MMLRSVQLLARRPASRAKSGAANRRQAGEFLMQLTVLFLFVSPHALDRLIISRLATEVALPLPCSQHAFTTRSFRIIKLHCR